MSVTAAMAFTAGLISFASPCVLPLVPAYISYISGSSVEELAGGPGVKSVRRAGMRAVLFVLGFSTVFVALGASATSLGELLSTKQCALMKVAGAVIVVFGLHMAGVLRIKALYAEKRFHIRFQKVGLAGAFLVGVMFAFGWTPCVTPVLGAVLVMAGQTESVRQGMALLAIYSLGLGIPFIVTGFATSAALKAMGRVKQHFRKIEIISGLLLVAVGTLVFTGSLQSTAGLIQERLYLWFCNAS